MPPSSDNRKQDNEFTIRKAKHKYASAEKYDDHEHDHGILGIIMPKQNHVKLQPLGNVKAPF